MEGDKTNLKKSFEKIKFSKLINKILPKLDPKRGKGDNGITAVIGGSLEYTGAPYYSAITAIKSGADLAHIFCHKEAAIPIKSYSPELIVHPAFEDKKETDKLDKIIRRISTVDALVIGCGLGREESLKEIFEYILEKSLKIESNNFINFKNNI
jgi:ATP-dependent NAD(P)H-hydrate dehydratase